MKNEQEYYCIECLGAIGWHYPECKSVCPAAIEDAKKIIQDFHNSGGYSSIDGANGKLSDKDLIIIAQNIKELMRKEQP